MEDWDSFTYEVEEYLVANEMLPASIVKVVKLNLEIGKEAPEEREGCEMAIRSLLKKRAGTPFKKGQKSGIPASVRVNIDNICKVFTEALTAYYTFSPIIPLITFKHGKSGGGCYNSADEYIKEEVKKMRTRLSNKYKNGEWDGEKLDSEEDTAPMPSAFDTQLG